MRTLFLATALFCLGCTAAQPASERTVAAYDIPLPTPADRADFLAILRTAAAVDGYHVDAATSDELRDMSTVSPIRLNATVWRGNDIEVVASAIDMVDHVGRVWITFSKGENPAAFGRFRTRLMIVVTRRWPQTASLPVLLGGNIPLAADLIRTPSGYKLKPSAQARYRAPSQ